MTARQKGKRGRRPQRASRWVARSGGARDRSGHRRVRRADRRRRRSRQGGGRGRARGRQIGGHRQQGAARAARVALAALAEKHRVALNFEAAVGGAIPIVKTLREGLAGNSFARIYGILNGTCNYILTRMEQEKLSFADCLQGRAAARLCRGRSDLRRRGPRHRAEARDPGEPRLRHQGRPERGLCRRHLLDHARRSRRRRRARLPRQAARRRGADREGHRAARASDHGAEGQRDRPGDGRHQCGHHRCRRDRADHAGRPRRRRHGDRLGGGRRHRRHRARRAHRAVRPAVGAAHRQPARRRCSATRAATTSAFWRATGRAPPRPSPSGSPSRTSRSNRSCSAIAARGPGRRRSERAGGPVPVILITYATSEDAVRKALAAVKATG